MVGDMLLFIMFGSEMDESPKLSRQAGNSPMA